jgi:cyclophilin family peptidyl-prolyl cis-trans isomerase
VSKASKRERQRLNRESRLEYEQTLDRRRRMYRLARFLVPIVLVVVAVVAVTSLSGDDEPSLAAEIGCREVDKAPKPKDATFAAAPPLTIDATATYTAVVDTNCGSFSMQLNPTEAPQTVNSFVFLANEGFYDDTTFHRVIKNFVIQGGDPAGDGTGGPGYTLPDEPPADGYVEGSVAMANAGLGTTGSQFYVVTSGSGAETLNAQLTPDGKFSYSILGQVVDGIETIDKINKLGAGKEATDQSPKAIVVIDKVTIQQT